MSSRARWAAIVAIAITLTSAACTSDADPSVQEGRDLNEGRAEIVVGSFDFAESRIIAEVYASVLEGHGYTVRRLNNVASREIMEPALEQDVVDLVPEYQGTALTFLSLGQITPPSSPRAAHRLLTEMFASRDIAVLDFAPAESKNEMVVTEATAAVNKLRTISDLQRVSPRMVLGGPAECPSRPLCLMGLEETYNMEFRTFLPLDTGGPLTVAALEGGEIDAGILFTTNPAINSQDFVVLEDDLNLQPPENIVPVVRQEVLDAYGPEFSELVNSVTALLSTATIRSLNERAEFSNNDFDFVARFWIEQEGLNP